MSKLFTPRGLLIQLMLYLIGRAIFTLVKSEMKTSQINPGTESQLIVGTGDAAQQVQNARSETQDLLNAINGQ